MNHGPRNAVLFIAMFAFLAGGVITTLPGTALAQDRAQIDQLFDQAQDLWKRGRTEEAAATLKQLLAADPTQAEAYELLRKAENQMFLDLLKAGGDSALAARRLLELAHPGELQRIKDDDAIKALVDQAVHGDDHGARTSAIRKLLANHGEYSVPHLFPYLGSNDTDERVYAILALTELGSEAVLPLIEVLHSDNWMIQQNAANAEESASAAEELSAQAEAMNRMVAELGSMVGGTTGSRDAQGQAQPAAHGPADHTSVHFLHDRKEPTKPAPAKTGTWRETPKAEPVAENVDGDTQDKPHAQEVIPLDGDEVLRKY